MNSLDRLTGWLGEADKAFYSTLHLPEGKALSSKAVVLCPPLGHEYVHSHRSYRHLAEQLAETGVVVVRFDLHGCGNSPGDTLDENCVQIWQQNIKHVCELLRQAGISEIGVFGIRFGGTLATLALKDNVCDYTIIWQPILRGKRYVRELQATFSFSGSEQNSEENTIALEAAGFAYSAPVLSAIKNIELDFNDTRVSENTFLLIDDNNPQPIEVIVPGQSAVLSGFSNMLAEPHFAKPPKEAWDQVKKWVVARSGLEVTKEGFQVEVWRNALASSVVVSASDKCDRTDLQSHSSLLEEVVDNTAPLFSVCTKPKEEKTPSEIIVLVNSGAVHHVGPNRLYVDLARGTASEGCWVYRIDLSHLGDSCRGSPKGENHPYAENAVPDVEIFISHLKNRFPQVKHIVVAGVCSGSYTAFHAAMCELSKFDSVVIINPLTFRWREGLSLEVPSNLEVAKEAKHYSSSITSASAWKKFFTGGVDYIYLSKFLIQLVQARACYYGGLLKEKLGLSKPSELAQSVSSILNSGKRLHFIVSETDPGYSLLLTEGGYRIKRMLRRKSITLDIVKQADHTFTRFESKQRLIRKFRRFMQTTRSDGQVSARSEM